MNEKTFYEFFAGGGMARLGLGSQWHCLFANDFDRTKAAAYRENWGHEHFRDDDINDLSPSDLSGCADLAWASFPCQDLSLAGNALGLGTATDQTRSGAFWAFWSLMEGLAKEKRGPKTIVLENVYGALTANQGQDFSVICRCLSLAGYRFGAVILDAVEFLPQSRPRMFLVAVRGDIQISERLLAYGPVGALHPKAMVTAMARLAEVDQARWVWWKVPSASAKRSSLMELLEPDHVVSWHDDATSSKLINMMSALNRQKLQRMVASGQRSVGTIYKRTRVEGGHRVQRAELRDDGVAGCLRTPGGGSSRQFVIVVDKSVIRTRLLTAREAARLMGLPDTYRLPSRYNEAYHLAGDGLAVPVVAHLAQHVIGPILDESLAVSSLAA
ncbi:DNA cytosine methyltransferase [Qipengyuania sp. ASV99]|uniref:DNA cytosine methyltransferase n=1 Tax=Qipengyuania sp. ASV99 TaxID=3399681 RepID=UPI003A4C7D61